MAATPISLEIYVPFCKRRCGYCDALVCPGQDTKRMEEYVAALGREIGALASEFEGRTVTSIHFAGGSPNLLGPRVLANIVKYIRQLFSVDDDCEMTLDCFSANVSVELLDRLRHEGLTRVGLEQETFDALQHLSLDTCYVLGAAQDAAVVVHGCRCRDLDISLLYGLKGQGVPSIEASVEMCERMGATHVTLSPLRLPAGDITDKHPAGDKPDKHPAGDKTDTCSAGDKPISPRNVYPDDEKRLALYRAAVCRLQELGYERYTQHHFAEPGHQAKYVLESCLDQDKVAFGLGAASRYDGIMCRNTDDLDTYLAHSDDYRQVMAESCVLDKKQVVRRRLADGFLAIGGVPVKMARCEDASLDATLAAFLKRDWMEQVEGTLRLTELGGFHYREIRDSILDADER